MEENDHAHTLPRLCRKGCGFYGSPNFEGFCSKCHRDMQTTAEKVQPTILLSSANSEVDFKTAEFLRGDELSNLTIASNSDQNSAELSEFDSESQICAPEDSIAKSHDGLLTSFTSTPVDCGEQRSISSACSATSSDAPSKKVPRCLICNKRVGLTGFNCHCGGLFCTVHRYSDSHNCTFDYRESGQADIRKANPQVVSSKINKI